VAYFARTDLKDRELTYKSISDLLQQLERDGKILRFVPKTRSLPARRLYLGTIAERERTSKDSAVNIIVGAGFVEASLTRWSSGGRIFADDRQKPRFLKELEPPPNDIWEIRVTEPVVQGRLLGAFIERDTLILLKLCTRAMLRNKSSPAWASVMRECESAWVGIFGSVPRMHAADIGDYVSENYDYFKLERPHTTGRAAAGPASENLSGRKPR
jgi:hypothetical protein